MHERFYTFSSKREEHEYKPNQATIFFIVAFLHNLQRPNINKDNREHDNTIRSQLRRLFNTTANILLLACEQAEKHHRSK